MHTLAQRVEAPFSAIVGLEWPVDQPERRTLRDTYRLMIRKLHGVPSILNTTVRVGRDGKPVLQHGSDDCFEIGVDGRVAGVIQDCGDDGWFFKMTNDDGGTITEQMPQAVGAMVRAFVNKAEPDAAAMRVFDDWNLVAEANAKIRTDRLFGDLSAGVPNTTDPDRRGFQPA